MPDEELLRFMAARLLNETTFHPGWASLLTRVADKLVDSGRPNNDSLPGGSSPPGNGSAYAELQDRVVELDRGATPRPWVQVFDEAGESLPDGLTAASGHYEPTRSVEVLETTGPSPAADFLFDAASPADAALLVALRNAAPTLIRALAVAASPPGAAPPDPAASPDPQEDQ